jgi:hypothetical protein
VREAEASPLLEAVARESLLKTLQVVRLTVWCIDLQSMEISGGDVITCSCKWCL